MSRPAGFEHSLDTIRKIRHAVTKKFSIIWFLKSGDTVELTDNLSLWASRNKLSKGTLWNTSKHKTRKYKGWKVQRWDITKFSQEIIEKLLKKIPKKSSYLIEKIHRFRPTQTIKETYTNYIQTRETARKQQERDEERERTLLSFGCG
jgi:hypothetical protein